MPAGMRLEGIRKFFPLMTSSLIYRLSELPIMMCDGTKAEQNEWEGKAGVRRRVMEEFEGSDVQAQVPGRAARALPYSVGRGRC